MSDKQVPLSIILRTVDKATAGLKSFNDKLARYTKPVKDFKEQLGDLRDHAGLLGLDAVADGFRGMGSAIKDVLGKVALVGGAVAGATAFALHLVDQFDKLGDTAERLGTSADFLAGMRYAAERAGAPVESLDEGLKALSQNMGQAKAGTGRMLKFLNQISPVLARQVVGAHNMEEALGLLADAAAKLPDAERRAALTQKTLGDAALAPLLARGSKGIQELLTAYAGLAGSQGEAAEAAGKTDDALKNLHAATQGVEAALITGLSPALTEIINKLTRWLVGHREDVKRWAEDFGQKLPGAVDQIVKTVTSAIDKVMKFIDDIGGVKVAIIGLAAVMTGPLIGAFISLGAVMLGTPFGLVLTSLAAIAAMVISVTDEIEKMNDAMDTSREKMLQDVATLSPEQFRAKYPQLTNQREANDAANALLDAANRSPDSASPWSMLKAGAGGMASRLPTRDLGMLAAPPSIVSAPMAASEVNVKVDFANAPRGMRASVDSKNVANVDMTVGHQMGSTP